MSGEHSPVGPSGAARRNQCPASVKLQALYPEDPDARTDAADGDAAHWAAAQMLAGTRVAEGVVAPNGVVLTEEMIDGALAYVEDITAELAPFGLTPIQGAIEVPVAIPRIHPQAWGTPDFRAWLMARAGPTLLIYDFKFGRRIVEAWENQQLAEYVAGCLDGVQLPDTAVNVIAKIVQPRAYHPQGIVREWRFNAADIRPLINTGSSAAHEALGDNPRAASGQECRDCSARHACLTFQREFYACLYETGRATPAELDAAALGTELLIATRAAEVIEARRSALEQQGLALARRGAAVPGYSVGYGAGRQRWKRPAAEVVNMGRMLGFELAKPVGAVTPKQALAAGMPSDLVQAVSDTPRGAARLERDTGQHARSIFAAWSRK